MLRGFIMSVHILLALMIIGLVLMQRGKGAEAGAGFGSGASGTVFGARGTATLFSKLTAVFAALFFTTSLVLAYMGTRSSAEPTTVIERAAQAAARARQAMPPSATSTPPASTSGAGFVPAPAATPAPAPSEPANGTNK
jgi:preprotein translocase subunit SecG